MVRYQDPLYLHCLPWNVLLTWGYCFPTGFSGGGRFAHHVPYTTTGLGDKDFLLDVISGWFFFSSLKSSNFESYAIRPYHLLSLLTAVAYSLLGTPPAPAPPIPGRFGLLSGSLMLSNTTHHHSWRFQEIQCPGFLVLNYLFFNDHILYLTSVTLRVMPATLSLPTTINAAIIFSCKPPTFHHHLYLSCSSQTPNFNSSTSPRHTSHWLYHRPTHCPSPNTWPHFPT